MSSGHARPCGENVTTSCPTDAQLSLRPQLRLHPQRRRLQLRPEDPPAALERRRVQRKEHHIRLAVGPPGRAGARGGGPSSGHTHPGTSGGHIAQQAQRHAHQQDAGRHSGTHISRTQAGTLRYPHRRCKAVPLDRTGVRGRGDADPRHRLPVPVGATAARRTLLHTSACVETARPSFCCCSCVYPFCVSSRCCVCAAHPCSASRPLWSLCCPCRLFVRLPPSRSPTV